MGQFRDYNENHYLRVQRPKNFAEISTIISKLFHFSHRKFKNLLLFFLNVMYLYLPILNTMWKQFF